MESNSVCNHTSDNKIRRPCINTFQLMPFPCSDLFMTSIITDRIADMKSYYQLIIKITISDERRIAKL